MNGVKFKSTYLPWEIRLFSKIKKTNSCWIWTHCIDPDGYSNFSMFGSAKKAHRITYELFKGKIPKGYEIDHLCKNTLCCNPDHLEAVTPKINSLRSDSPWAKNARKTHCPQNHPYSKENTYRTKNGGRVCKICNLRKGTKWRNKK